jgi:cyclic pyranopterin phosphate synthase
VASSCKGDGAYLVGRVHTDLLISVTDRSNLRCVYYMPDEGMTFLPRSQLLSYEEIGRVAAVARDLGVTSIRLTGGEPLVRKDLTSLVSRLTSIGLEDLALTTNGMQLAKMAAGLAAAGLKRVNVSCDSLRADRFESIRRRGDLATVLSAMDAAEAAGLLPLKVNVVLLRGRSDDEVLDFAAFARETGRIVRFIEFMPLDAQGQWDRSSLVPGQEVFERISQVWPLEALGDHGEPAPAERLRLTADGAFLNCPFSDDERSARDVLRGGAGDGEIARMLREAVWAKFPGHATNQPGFLRPARSMSMIGG